jgi:hypothetical protein
LVRNRRSSIERRIRPGAVRTSVTSTRAAGFATRANICGPEHPSRENSVLLQVPLRIEGGDTPRDARLCQSAGSPPNPVEIFISMNEEGEIGIGTSSEDAATNLMDNHGAYAMRTVCLNVMMAKPELQNVDVTVPDETGERVKVEKAA